MTALVLSGSYQETNRFATRKRLGFGIRHVVRASTIAGIRPTSVHVLPSFADRRDIHSVKVELKHIRRRCPNIPWIEYHLVDGDYVDSNTLETEVEVAPEPDPSPDAVPGQTAIEEHLEPEPEPEPEPTPKPEPSPKPRTKKPKPAPKVEAAEDDIPDWMKS